MKKYDSGPFLPTNGPLVDIVALCGAEKLILTPQGQSVFHRRLRLIRAYTQRRGYRR
jgi:hypothetical protein